MQFTDALKIVEALADGYDPNTGECLSVDNACQRPDVIQALYLVVQKARHPGHPGQPASAVANASKPWTADDADGNRMQVYQHRRSVQALPSPSNPVTKAPSFAPLAQIGQPAV